MKYMKAFQIDGLIPKVVDIDYNFLCELKCHYEEKGKTQKAEYISSLIAKLDVAVADGETMSADLIEKTINDTIDENEAKQQQLKAQIKALDKENAFLSGYSKRCIDEDPLDVIISVI